MGIEQNGKIRGEKRKEVENEKNKWLPFSINMVFALFLGHLIGAKDFIRQKKRKTICSIIMTEKLRVCPRMKKPSAPRFFLSSNFLKRYRTKVNHLNKGSMAVFIVAKRRSIFPLDRNQNKNKEN